MTPELPVRLPTRLIDFPESLGVRWYAFHPTEPRLIAAVTQNELDPLVVLAANWTLLAGALFGLFLAALLLRVRSVARSPQRAGVPVCGRCSYDLSGHSGREGGTCPECGVSLAKFPAVIGRSAGRRLALRIVLVLLTGLGLLAGTVLGWTGPSQLPSGVGFPSSRMAALARECNWPWLTRHIRSVDRVYEVELETGATQRRRSVAPIQRAYLRLSPDGRSLLAIVASQIPNDVCTVVSINIRTGRTERQRPVKLGGYRPSLLHISDDGRTVYLALHDAPKAPLLLELDLASGAVVERAWYRPGAMPDDIRATDTTLRAVLSTSPLTVLASHRKAAGMIRPAHVPAFIAAPNRAEFSRSARDALLVHHPESGVAIELAGSEKSVWAQPALVANPPGVVLFESANSVRLALVGLDDGKPLRTWTGAGPRRLASGDLATHAAGRVVVSMLLPRTEALLGDLEAMSWTARLKFPDQPHLGSPFSYPEPSAHASGRWVAIDGKPDAKPRIRRVIYLWHVEPVSDRGP